MCVCVCVCVCWCLCAPGCGSIADPQYHNAGDVVKRDGFDIEGQLLSLSRAFISTALTVLEIIG